MVVQGTQSQMKATRKQTRTNATPGFAIEIKDDSELCGGMLIAEMEGGSYEPIGLVISVNEAIEIAQGDMRHRMKQLERGGTPACPEEYVVWARGVDGDCKVAKRFMP
jgi:hypothetical protein